MPATREIRVRDLVRDIRLGMSDSELMIRYRLSGKALQRVFNKLLSSKAIRHHELYARSATYKDTIDLSSARKYPREDLTVPVQINDVVSGETGLVRDISEGGFRVAGIRTRVGEVRSFRLPVDVFTPADPLIFDARCRWVKKKGSGLQYLVSGFEIINISENDQQELHKFVGFFTLARTGEWEP